VLLTDIFIICIFFKFFFLAIEYIELMVMLSLGRTRLEESKGALRSWRDNLLQALLPLIPNAPTTHGVQALLDKCVQLQAAILQRDQVFYFVSF
jgi:hypothetical protein